MVDELNENLREYARRLETALAEKRPHTTFNRDISHALAIILAVFRFAEKEVRLLSHELLPALYGNPLLLKAVRSFLAKGGKLKILVECDIGQDHPMRELLDTTPEGISIRRVPEDKQSEYKYNFLVMDDCGFRFEHDRAEHTALAGFHDADSKQLASVLRNTFDSMSLQALEMSHAAQC